MTKNLRGELFARCAWGFEDVLADELRELAVGSVRPLQGGVAFAGGLDEAYRVCLWSRVATRVQLVLARVGATTAERLYEETVAFAWEDHVRPGATIAVRAHGTNAALRNTAFTALKTKDALCDRLREVRGTRPNVDGALPDFEVDVAVHAQKATLFLNLSGPSLHRRGYRVDGVQTEAPLKETLAAGILRLVGWPELAAEGGALADPMCGSGTFAIEAALMAAHVAPGILRERWGFAGWLGHDEALWRLLVAEARASRWDEVSATIVAGDIDDRAVELARTAAARAGVDGLVRWHVDDAAHLKRRVRWLHKRGTRGLMVTNPPYGYRLSSPEELPQVYAALAAAVDAVPATWELAVLTPDAGMDAALGRVPYEKLACYNGPIEAAVRRYRLDENPTEIVVTSLAGKQHQVRVGEVASEQFASRLRKVARDKTRAAHRLGLGCYRVYDADLPDYPFAVDVFCESGGEKRLLARVEERTPARRAEGERRARSLADAASIAAAVFDVPRADVVVVRAHEGGSDASHVRREIVVSEGGLSFVVDVAAPHAGLALDQQDVRLMVGQMARDKRVACLFATGGGAMAHAAAGGAKSVVVVDASRTHLDAVRDQLKANGFAGRSYAFACDEVRAWVARQVKERRTYDLVFCAAPAWLPAKDAGGHEWDAERDLVGLLRQVLKLSSSGGSLVLVPPANAKGIEIPGVAIEDRTDLTGCRCLVMTPIPRWDRGH